MTALKHYKPFKKIQFEIHLRDVKESYFSTVSVHERDTSP